MADKVKYEIEFNLRTSISILYSKLSTPSGLADWFANDVNVSRDGKVFTFIWDQSEEEAELISKTRDQSVKFRWVEDEEDNPDSYFEFVIKADPITSAVALFITDFAEEDEIEDGRALWESQMDSLRNAIGA